MDTFMCKGYSRKCSDIFESICFDHQKCFRWFIKNIPGSIKYQIEHRGPSYIIYDEHGTIIKDSYDNPRKINLFDYTIKCNNSYYLEYLIKYNCPCDQDIGKLFCLLENAKSLENSKKIVSCILSAVYVALEKGWYYRTFENAFKNPDLKLDEDFVFRGTYILKMVEYRWMIRDDNIYKKIIFKLLDCGEEILVKNRYRIEHYLKLSSQKIHKNHNSYIEEIVGEMYKYVEEWRGDTTLDIKEPNVGD